MKWESGSGTVVAPKFSGITISDTQGGTIGSQYVDFVGSFSPVSLETNDKTVLYLGAGNTLYYPSEAMTVNACRAVFRLHNGITAGDLSYTYANVRSFVLNFGDGEETTAIVSVSEESGSQGAVTGWYTLDARRLNGQPTTKGLYIHNGRKVLIVK